MPVHRSPAAVNPAWLLSLTLGLSSLFLPSWTGFAADFATGNEPIEPIAHIEQAAKQTGLAQIGGTDPSTLEPQAIDSRLRYPACHGPLSGALAPGMRTPARMTVEVRCAEPRWRIYVGLTVHTVEHVVVTTHPLTRQAVIGPDDLVVVEREVSLLPGGFYSSPEPLYGTLTSRVIGAGEILTPNLVQIPPVIKRGQQVTVLARRGSLEVRQSGTALGDAGISQRVMVQTGYNGGGRPVEAIVRAPDLVEVALP